MLKIKDIQYRQIFVINNPVQYRAERDIYDYRYKSDADYESKVDHTMEDLENKLWVITYIPRPQERFNFFRATSVANGCDRGFRHSELCNLSKIGKLKYYEIINKLKNNGFYPHEDMANPDILPDYIY